MDGLARWFYLTRAGARRIVVAASTLVLGMLTLAAPAGAYIY